jgi:hypothetical protein
LEFDRRRVIVEKNKTSEKKKMNEKVNLRKWGTDWNWRNGVGTEKTAVVGGKQPTSLYAKFQSRRRFPIFSVGNKY